MTDSSDLRGRLAEYVRITQRETSETIRQFARVACVNLATETQPFGDDKEGQSKGETAVARDIYKVYYPATGTAFLNQATNAVRGYYLQKNSTNASGNADKFKTRLLGYQMANNTGALAKIAADIGFTDAQIDSFEPSRHKSSRDSRGRVRGARPQLVIGGEDGLEKYVEETQRKVGLTKAGWAKCAEAIPLNRASSATRGIPQWVTRNKGRASGRIEDQSQDQTNPRVRMTNATPWTSQVLTPQQANKALRLARDNFIKYMNTAIKKTLRDEVKLKSA